MMTVMDGGEEDRFAKARERMLRWDLMGRDITDPDILRVMWEVPREEFVPEIHKSQAYADNPLTIGMGQTISQPYIVALMTQELRLNRELEVLEIGTGSGYQTAILGKLVKKVYTIERVSELATSAQAVLGKLGITNVEFYLGDGSCGWPEQRVFDRIIITAAVPKMPEPLIEQLTEGGLMVGPVGSGGFQQLVVCEKKHDKLLQTGVCDCRFVKLLGKYGFEEA
ncbi:MAG TPA: protein-L-isoaspartate(D-aspartate) O-methyltransferase [Sedimentisphaerales bacterium]|nr:protein-L-isoaspartate(D-aspartate) O-methyltransferase [Sedimentisphaerales bacterium]